MAIAQWTQVAADELGEIAYWIAVKEGRPQTARSIVEELRVKADWYANSPELGQRNPDFPEGWLWFRHKRWIVLYQPREDGIDVLRILDSARDFPRLFP